MYSTHGAREEYVNSMVGKPEGKRPYREDLA